jgi:hypothetical protein
MQWPSSTRRGLFANRRPAFSLLATCLGLAWLQVSTASQGAAETPSQELVRDGIRQGRLGPAWQARHIAFTVPITVDGTRSEELELAVDRVIGQADLARQSLTTEMRRAFDAGSLPDPLTPARIEAQRKYIKRVAFERQPMAAMSAGDRDDTYVVPPAPSRFVRNYRDAYDAWALAEDRVAVLRQDPSASADTLKQAEAALAKASNHLETEADRRQIAVILQNLSFHSPSRNEAALSDARDEFVVEAGNSAAQGTPGPIGWDASVAMIRPSRQITVGGRRVAGYAFPWAERAWLQHEFPRSLRLREISGGSSRALFTPNHRIVSRLVVVRLEATGDQPGVHALAVVGIFAEPAGIDGEADGQTFSGSGYLGYHRPAAVMQRLRDGSF